MPDEDKIKRILARALAVARCPMCDEALALLREAAGATVISGFFYHVAGVEGAVGLSWTDGATWCAGVAVQWHNSDTTYVVAADLADECTAAKAAISCAGVWTTVKDIPGLDSDQLSRLMPRIADKVLQDADKVIVMPLDLRGPKNNDPSMN